MIFYANFRMESATGVIRVSGGQVCALLVGAAYKHDVRHRRRIDIIGEVTGVGYVEGGKLLEKQDFRQDPKTFAGVLRAEPLLWKPATIKGVRGVVLYQQSGNGAKDDPLIAYEALAEELSCSGWGELRIDWNPDGTLRLE